MKPRAVTYCILPRELASELHEVLRDHFREDPSVEIVVELREGERRHGERRAAAEPEPAEDRRRVKSPSGRRVADRREATEEADPLDLPRAARRHADQLRFVRRLEPGDLSDNDIESARLVARFQAGDQSAFSDLYLINFGQIYSYARIALRDHHEAEDLTQQVFLKVMNALPRYKARPGTPFRAWLFRIARNETISHLRKHGRLEVEDPEAVDRRRMPEVTHELGPSLDWISDGDLLLFIERLPQLQRQAIVLRYMLDLSTEEMCEVLERSAVAVRKLEHRALRYLEQRLAATRARREQEHEMRNAMRMRTRRPPVVSARRAALAQPLRTSRER